MTVLDRRRHLHGDGVAVEKERDVLLGANERFLPGIAELLRQAGRIRGTVGKLLHDLPQPRVWPAPRAALRPNLNLARTIPAEHRTVLNERDLQSLARRGDRGAQSGVAAANHHQIELRRLRRNLGQAEQCLALGARHRRAHGRVSREEQRVAASFESSQIAQCNRVLSRGCDFNRAAGFPKPFGVHRAERVRNGWPSKTI